MSQRTLKSLDQAAKGIRSLNQKQLLLAYKKSVEFYIDKLIIRHFAPGYARKAGWKPNTPEYQKWKQKRYGDLPQLVLEGKLKRDARRGKAVRSGKKYIAKWSGQAARTYGIIQARKHRRDWATPSRRDGKDIVRFYKKTLARMRSKQRGVKIRRR